MFLQLIIEFLKLHNQILQNTIILIKLDQPTKLDSPKLGMSCKIDNQPNYSLKPIGPFSYNNLLGLFINVLWLFSYNNIFWLII